jgi:hypothetical protein
VRLERDCRFRSLEDCEPRLLDELRADIEGLDERNEFWLLRDTDCLLALAREEDPSPLEDWPRFPLPPWPPRCAKLVSEVVEMAIVASVIRVTPNLPHVIVVPPVISSARWNRED